MNVNIGVLDDIYVDNLFSLIGAIESDSALHVGNPFS